MDQLEEIECRNCHRMFRPSKYNKHSQKYCTLPECHRVSHNASQAKQRRKSCNQTLEKRMQNSNYVKDWQKRHPGYSTKYQKKRKKTKTKSLKGHTFQAQKGDAANVLLSDFVLTNTVKFHSLKISQLVDLVEYQKNVIDVLIIHLTDSHLSDLMDFQKNVFYDRGRSFSGRSSGTSNIKINKTQRKSDHEKKNTDHPWQKTQNSPPFQLG